MHTDSFVLFFSLSRNIGEIAKDKERQFYHWLREEFACFRPTYLFYDLDEERLEDKYKTLFTSLKAHGRALKVEPGRFPDDEETQIGSLPESLVPHVYFSAEKTTQKEGPRAIANVNEMYREETRNPLLDQLSLRFGLRIPKKELASKLAEIGKAAGTIYEYIKNRNKIVVDIYDRYYSPQFIDTLLAEKIEHTRNLSFRFHTSDFAVLKKIVPEGSDLDTYLKCITGEETKAKCIKEFVQQLQYEWEKTKRKIEPLHREMWEGPNKLKIYLWQPKTEQETGLHYKKSINSVFHGRKISIDNKFHFSADHSFHLPSITKAEIDEPVGFHVTDQETYQQWANARDLTEQRYRINGKPCLV